MLWIILKLDVTTTEIAALMRLSTSHTNKVSPYERNPRSPYNL